MHQHVFSYSPGANLFTLWLTPKAASTVFLGASGAVFGLFATAVLSKLQLRPGKLLEAFVLG